MVTKKGSTTPVMISCGQAITEVVKWTDRCKCKIDTLSHFASKEHYHLIMCIGYVHRELTVPSIHYTLGCIFCTDSYDLILIQSFIVITSFT